MLFYPASCYVFSLIPKYISKDPFSNIGIAYTLSIMWDTELYPFKTTSKFRVLCIFNSSSEEPTYENSEI